MADFQVLAEDLSGAARRERQNAAAAFSQEAKDNPEAVLEYAPALIDALNRPEASTRWNCLEALLHIAQIRPELCDGAFAGAEAALFDEDNGVVRLFAMRFLCRWGRSAQDKSAQAWPLIDEAIQCYHGDYEFSDMMTAVVEFSQGDLSEDVRQGLAARVSFDAKNAKGWLARKSQQVIANLEAGK